jgi:hypothetical protein
MMSVSSRWPQDFVWVAVFAQIQPAVLPPSSTTWCTVPPLELERIRADTYFTVDCAQ